ncbi:MAG: hypothetical protein JWO06_2326 [Bacteroidota bacterium]|nr:hypothetical protein [Bacteroidota bacterium]
MKNAGYIVIIITAAVTLASCQKEQQYKPVYDTSTSSVTWSVSPIIIGPGNEKLISPPFMNGWCFDTQYHAQRMPLTAAIGPFYGYPVGAFTPDSKLSFDYSNGSSAKQTMSLFLNSALKITGAGTYKAQACFDNGYAGRIGMNGVSENLYLSGGDQNFIIDSYHSGYLLDDKTNATIVKGRFQLTISDSPGGINPYMVYGSFQLPFVKI